MSEISVLVPSFNHAPFIERTLESIFAQTLKPKKLIVIDDGSKDESVEIIERILIKSPIETEFIRRENRGLSATLNEGLEKASGEFFAYLGSDDVWLPAFLEEQIALLQKRPNAVLAFSHAFLIDENDSIIDCTNNWTNFADGNVLPFLLSGQVFSSPGVVYRHEFLRKYEWNENSILEDYELYLKLSGEGDFARNEKVLSGWRQHGSNVSGDFPKMLGEWLAAQDRNFEKLNLSRGELDKLQTELKFDSVASFIRGGYRREAIRLFFENFKGAKSAAQIAKMLVKMVIPKKIFQLNRERKKQAAIKKYGKLRI